MLIHYDNHTLISITALHSLPNSTADTLTNPVLTLRSERRNSFATMRKNILMAFHLTELLERFPRAHDSGSQLYASPKTAKNA